MNDLSNHIQLRLERINKIEDNFYAEFCERERMSKKLSKYIAALIIFPRF